MKINILPFAIVVVLTASSCGQKKLLVLSNDKPAISEDSKTIVCKATKGHEERTLDFTGDALKVSTAVGDATISIPEKGYYVVNLKSNDTIIGSYVRFTTQEGAHRVMTQDDLKKSIDSLQQLIQGKNVSEANRNFFILPNTGARISPNADAFVVAPYHPMTDVPTGDGNTAPEVYQFYTINEVRGRVADLLKLTGAKADEPAAPAKK